MSSLNVITISSTLQLKPHQKRHNKATDPANSVFYIGSVIILGTFMLALLYFMGLIWWRSRRSSSRSQRLGENDIEIMAADASAERAVSGTLPAAMQATLNSSDFRMTKVSLNGSELVKPSAATLTRYVHFDEEALAANARLIRQQRMEANVAIVTVVGVDPTEVVEEKGGPGPATAAYRAQFPYHSFGRLVKQQTKAAGKMRSAL